MPKNIYGTELQPCCIDPMMGFFRDDFCNTTSMDQGPGYEHGERCRVRTAEFRAFTKVPQFDNVANKCNERHEPNEEDDNDVPPSLAAAGS